MMGLPPTEEGRALSNPFTGHSFPQKLIQEYRGRFRVMTYTIRSIPTLIVYKDTREIDRVSGAMSTQGLIGWVKRFT